MMKVAIVGAAGRMGIRLIHAVVEADGLEMAGAIERLGHPQVGMDAGLIAGVGTLGVKISDDLAKTMADADVLIDFTFPDVTLKNLAVCADLGKWWLVAPPASPPSNALKRKNLHKKFRWF